MFMRAFKIFCKKIILESFRSFLSPGIARWNNFFSFLKEDSKEGLNIMKWNNTKEKEQAWKKKAKERGGGDKGKKQGVGGLRNNGE